MRVTGGTFEELLAWFILALALLAIVSSTL